MKKIIAIALSCSVATVLMYCSSQQEERYAEKEQTDSLTYGKPAGYEGVVEESKELKNELKEEAREGKQEMKEDWQEAKEEVKEESRELKQEGKEKWEEVKE